MPPAPAFGIFTIPNEHLQFPQRELHFKKNFNGNNTGRVRLLQRGFSLSFLRTFSSFTSRIAKNVEAESVFKGDCRKRIVRYALKARFGT